MFEGGVIACSAGSDLGVGLLVFWSVGLLVVWPFLDLLVVY